MKVYVAGPYTKHDQAMNVAQAIKIGNILLQLGFTPFIPHLTHFWHMIHPRKWKEWLDYDLEWLKECDVLFRIEGKSEGADIEEKWATEWGIPIVKSISELEKL